MKNDAFQDGPDVMWTSTPSPGSTSISSGISEDCFRGLAPPKGVFWLGRKGGVFWDPNGADQFAHSLSLARLGFLPGEKYLDFGSASGRTVRTLAEAVPGAEWHGCDPIATSIEWAATAMPHIQFRISPQNPPTDYHDASFDGVYAVSVWSHFAKEAALAWLSEMHRIVKPGGWLAFSTHGTAAFRHRIRRNPDRRERFIRMWHRMLREGFVFVAPQTGEVSPSLDVEQWGFAFMTAEWVAASIAPKWALLVYDPARYGGHQDIYVLQRR